MIIRTIILFIVMTMRVFSAGHILMYHRIGDSRHPSTNVSVDAFERQLDYLAEEGYEAVELSRIAERIREGRSVPGEWVAITIDDAYRSFYENGLPILRRRGMPFTLFVNTEAVDRRYGDFMTWEMVEDTAEYGEIGGHSHTHPSLPKISTEKARAEIEISKRLLEERLQRKMRYFAYPYGEYSEEVAELLREAGYEASFKQVMGAADGSSDLYAINRIPMGENTSLGFYLRMGHLPMTWEQVDVEGDLLVGARIEVPQGVERLEVFLSGYGWEWTRVEAGRLHIDKRLMRSRNNLIVRDEKGRYNDYLILK